MHCTKNAACVATGPVPVLGQGECEGSTYRCKGRCQAQFTVKGSFDAVSADNKARQGFLQAVSLKWRRTCKCKSLDPEPEPEPEPLPEQQEEDDVWTRLDPRAIEHWTAADVLFAPSVPATVVSVHGCVPPPSGKGHPKVSVTLRNEHGETRLLVPPSAVQDVLVASEVARWRCIHPLVNATIRNVLKRTRQEAAACVRRQVLELVERELEEDAQGLLAYLQQRRVRARHVSPPAQPLFRAAR